MFHYCVASSLLSILFYHIRRQNIHPGIFLQSAGRLSRNLSKPVDSSVMYVLFTFVKYQTNTGSWIVGNIAWLLYIHSIKLNSIECYLYFTLNSYMNARNFNVVIQYRPTYSPSNIYVWFATCNQGDIKWWVCHKECKRTMPTGTYFSYKHQLSSMAWHSQRIVLVTAILVYVFSVASNVPCAQNSYWSMNYKTTVNNSALWYKSIILKSGSLFLAWINFNPTMDK